MGQSRHLTLNLNARIMPFDRGDLFEDPINDMLQEAGIGEVDGGGTLQEKTGEIINCDVEICLTGNLDENYEKLKGFLGRLWIPKGSFLVSEDKNEEIGFLEGLALYLNGTDLEDEVYKSCDVNFVISELLRALGEDCKFYSYWQGPEETALYFYGQSFGRMNSLMTPFIEEYPLCNKSRVVQIAR